MSARSGRLLGVAALVAALAAPARAEPGVGYGYGGLGAGFTYSRRDRGVAITPALGYGVVADARGHPVLLDWGSTGLGFDLGAQLGTGAGSGPESLAAFWLLVNVRLGLQLAFQNGAFIAGYAATFDFADQSTRDGEKLVGGPYGELLFQTGDGVAYVGAGGGWLGLHAGLRTSGFGLELRYHRLRMPWQPGQEEPLFSNHVLQLVVTKSIIGE